MFIKYMIQFCYNINYNYFENAKVCDTNIIPYICKENQMIMSSFANMLNNNFTIKLFCCLLIYMPLPTNAKNDRIVIYP